MFGNNYNPYYNYMQPQTPRMDQQFTQLQPQPLQQYRQSIGLQGKSVDSLDVVKAVDIPLDGSVSYFPLVDGTAIITKQLQQDGTSKIVIYKPIKDEEKTVQQNYVTPDEMNDAIKNIKLPDNSKDIKDLKDEIKNIKRQIRDLLEELKED